MKLNKQGYEDYLKAIQKKEKDLAAVRLYKGTEAIYQGDNWHDNPTLYQTEMQERTLMREISEMRNNLLNAEIVENLGDESLIDIGDVVKINMIFSEDDIELETFKLVATNPNFDRNQEISEVSINSPLGKAIYHKKIGDMTSYKVNDETIQIEIIEKIQLDLEIGEESLKKRR